MNKIKGTIRSIAVESNLTLIDVQCAETVFKAVVLESPDSNSQIKVGNDVIVLFKETEVIIATHPASPISLRNRVLCDIVAIKQGKLLCDLSLNSQLGVIHSIITRNAVEQLELKPGVKVWAMIKTNEVMLEYI